MKPVLDWLAQEWLALAAFLVAALSFRAARPRIRVRATTCIEGDPERNVARSAVHVTVTNDGGSPAMIRMVHFAPVSGGFGVYPSKTTRGPDFSDGHVELAPHGGFKLWSFDYHEMKRDAQRTVRDEPIVMRAGAVIGSRTVWARTYTTLSGYEPKHQPRVVKITRWFRSLRKPNVQIEWGLKLATVDLETGTAVHRVKNHGNGIARDVRISLVAVREDTDSERRIDDFPVRRFRIVLPRTSRSFHVPVDLPPVEDGETLYWQARARGGGGSGVGAYNRAELEPLVRDYQRRVAQRANPPSAGEEPGSTDT